MTDDGWGRIERVDGLSGWCRRIFFSPISRTPPELICQKLSPGIMYVRKQISMPRKTVAHFINLFLDDGDFEFFVTPADSNGFLCSRTTSQFLDEFNMHIAINGDSYSYLGSARSKASGTNSCGDHVRPNGFAASQGTIYSRRRGPTFFMDHRNQGTFLFPQGKIYNALSGNQMLLLNGNTVKELPEDDPHARTAIGISKNQRVVTLMVVDGHQKELSEGLTTRELAELLLNIGVWTALNLDGGGSSTLILRGVDDKARQVNSPIEKDVPGTERTVANHLGIRILKKTSPVSLLARSLARFRK